MEMPDPARVGKRPRRIFVALVLAHLLGLPSPSPAPAAAPSGEAASVVKSGEDLFWGEAQCFQCHRMGERGEAVRGPDLAGIGGRAAERGPGSATEYLVASVLEPSAHVVEGYPDEMPKAHLPPVDLGAEQVRAIVAYLQNRGGEVDLEAIELDPERLREELPPNPYREGDPEKGAEVFRQQRCHACHRVGERKPVSIGPELTEVGAYRGWPWLAEAILDPNAEVGANWRNVSVELKSGEEISGVLQQRTDELLQVLYSAEKVRRIPAEEVARVEFPQLTRMPENYGELMDEDELADLVAYLQSLKGD